MPELRPVGLDALIASLLVGTAPCRALDALVHVLRECASPAAVRQGVCPDVAALVASMAPPPPYTADPAHARLAARARGMVVAGGPSAAGGWAGVWLPPPGGEEPIMMFAETEARAACAALAEGMLALSRDAR